MFDWMVATAIDLAERRRVPDSLIRWGMRRAVASRLTAERGRVEERTAFWSQAQEGPVAVMPDRANRQHYEVPAAFFDLVLGPRRKYSAGWWPDGVETLEAAEEAMLEVTACRAGIVDGDVILDLGCGWGSFTMWAAEHFPSSEIVAVSNSKPQREHIRRQAVDAGVGNVTVITADVNDFEPERRFDRIISIEMLEHVRNHPEVFRRLRSWVRDEGSVFVHVFAHRQFAYPYEVEGPAAWMAETFFSGGVMPSRRLLPLAAERWFSVDGDWWFDGSHYARTLEAWLRRMDTHGAEVRAALAPVHGDDVDRWLQRWRMFFMACAELFSFAGGAEWGVVHQRFAPT
jgi:cyclopropane-fatty-acyl-phospholipid synthase